MDTGRHGQTDGAIAGQVLGDRYQLVSVLGSGGMGTVYKAIHMGLGRAVAIKLLHPHIVGDERSVQRFNQEMQVMSALNHPHLIAITDAGVTKERAPYFVMEYLEGHSLSEELDRSGNLPDAQAIKVALQIADALDYAHSKGIVHRDLKPNNIMLVGRNYFVKVVDLGIAKLASMGTGSDSLQKLTQTGEIFGSPLYMSPEQCLGKNVDYRADIYGLGCLIYEMVSNNLPITGETPIETLMRHISDPPKPLSQVPGLTMTPSMAGVEQIVMRCLEKDPARRFQSMAELQRALEQVQQGSSAGGGDVVPSTSEQRETRLSQGQIVPPVVGGGLVPLPRVEYSGEQQDNFGQRLSEPNDRSYRQAPTVDLSNQLQQKPAGQSFLPGQVEAKNVSHQQLQAGVSGANDSPVDDWRGTDGGDTGGPVQMGTMGGTEQRGSGDRRTTDGVSIRSGPKAGGSGGGSSFERYIPIMIVCAAVVIGIIGVASVVMVFQSRSAPVVPNTNTADAAQRYLQIEQQLGDQRQRRNPNFPVQQESEGVELSTGDTPSQVFMVAEYMGIRPEEFKDNAKEWGDTTVLVKYEKKPIVLFLSGYCPIHWVVRRENSKVKIEKICVNGYFAMTVDAPAGIPIEKSWYTHFDEKNEKTEKASHVNPFPIFAFAQFQDVKENSGWAEVAATVKQATGQEVYKFWGKYSGDNFVLE